VRTARARQESNRTAGGGKGPAAARGSKAAGVPRYPQPSVTLARPHYPGAVAPERTSSVEAMGVRLNLSEWGDPAAPPLLLCHGMFDHGRGFDLLAPRLASRFRVVALDARGHGDSDWADAYTWDADVQDIVQVLAFLGRPAHLVGHSKGGGQATDAAIRAPQAVRSLVNIDGFGPPAEGFTRPGGPPAELPIPQRMAFFLDRRRAAAELEAWRPYPSLDDLVERRRKQNPRLSREWLRYFLFHGARESENGWRWKADPHAGQGFGPWRPEWIGPGWRHLRAPLLAVIGSEPDTWGPLPEELIRERLSFVPNLERATVEGAGHFVHMEQPAATAEVLLAFLER
jgi:pimeloyl-ACP methyl ester carboxylesterase